MRQPHLSRLADKGFVSVRREGKSNLYTPLVDQDAYQAFDSRAVPDRLYGSPRNFVAALARDGMRRDELEKLQALFDQLNGGQGRPLINKKPYSAQMFRHAR